AMTVLSEVGDKTFFAAAILAMRHPRKLVLAGCLSALTVMTALSASLGWAAPNLISRKWTHHITTLLFFVFGIWSLWEGFKEEGESEDLAELEAKLDADFKSNKGESKNKSKATEDTKKKQRPFLMQFFSPIFIKVSTRQLLIYGNGRQLWCLWFNLDIYLSIHLCAVGIFHHFLW
uniref:GDT1 family protein n=1 Tax=Aegilops tauschii subsp. strangulata TaxID=200361 RepID=A0A453QG40_AEGTS